MLFVFEWDCLNLSVYNLTDNMKEMVEKIALSEGPFAGNEQGNFQFKKLLGECKCSSIFQYMPYTSNFKQ